MACLLCLSYSELLASPCCLHLKRNLKVRYLCYNAKCILALYEDHFSMSSSPAVLLVPSGQGTDCILLSIAYTKWFVFVVTWTRQFFHSHTSLDCFIYFLIFKIDKFFSPVPFVSCNPGLLIKILYVKWQYFVVNKIVYNYL